MRNKEALRLPCWRSWLDGAQLLIDWIALKFPVSPHNESFNSVGRVYSNPRRTTSVVVVDGGCSGVPE